MGKRTSYSRIRYAFLGGSILCLILAAAFIQRLVGNDLKNKAQVEAPIKVNHRVLFISSYDPLYFTYADQKSGLESGLYPNGIEYDVVYMDSKNYNTQQDIFSFHDFLKKRLSTSKRGYEAVIIGDDAALEFAIMYQKELFDQLPIVFFGINDLSLAKRAASLPNVTGLYEQNYLQNTLELAIKLFPGTKKFIGLHDQSVAGTADYEIFNSFPELYPDYLFINCDVSHMTQSQMINLLEDLPKDSILIYMTCYSDMWGNNYSIRSRTQTIAEHTHVPIMRNYVCVDNKSLLGGIYMNFQHHCEMASHLIADILNGRDIDTSSITS